MHLIYRFKSNFMNFYIKKVKLAESKTEEDAVYGI